MSFKYKSNINRIIASLKNKDVRAMQAAKGGMVRGMQFYEGYMIRTQMTGRKSDDFGLNVQTGNLRASWAVNSENEGMGGDLVVTLGTRTKYAAVHQFGYPPRNIPKRLRVLEEFKTMGNRMIGQSVSKALFQEYKK